jgi:ribosome-binding protein aMBF1 (putative translation factor)
MIRDGQIFCDTCGKAITRTTASLEGDGARMHNVCSDCFTNLKKKSIPPA